MKLRREWQNAVSSFLHNRDHLPIDLCDSEIAGIRPPLSFVTDSALRCAQGGIPFDGRCLLLCGAGFFLGQGFGDPAFENELLAVGLPYRVRNRLQLIPGETGKVKVECLDTTL